ncbi:MAG: hypothetical protein D6732_04195 [Methanobacteriota archaeon]|nr:MAG: hypothetical protein D6732_04195 [Euryarchaeota archaeon]
MEDTQIEENVFISAKNLPDPSRQFLLKILSKQGDIEYGMYNLHLVWQSKAESSEARWRMARIVSAEIRHGLQVTRFLRDFGEEGEGIADELFKRKLGEHEFEIFNKPFEDWVDVCAFSCFVPLVDVYQLKMLQKAKYAPLRRAMPLIINEESLHPAFGINGLRRALDTNPEQQANVEKRIREWIEKAKMIFGYGLPESELDAPEELGIPKWDRQQFETYYQENVSQILEKIGLKI